MNPSWWTALADCSQNEFVFLLLVYNRRKCKFVLHIGWLSFDKKLVYINCSTSQWPSAVRILHLQSPMVLVKSKLLTKAWGQDGWMLSKFFSSCLLTETESRSAIEERAQHIFIKGIIKFLKKLWCCVGMEYYKIIWFSCCLQNMIP